MDKEYLQSLYTPEQQLLLFGDANYFNNNVDNDLPFKSMVDMAAENANLDLFPAPQDFYTSPTYLMKQAQKFDQNPFRTGITASSNAIPFEQDPIAIAQGFVKGSPSDASFPGANFQFLESANEDESDDEPKTKKGIARLFEFLGQFSPVKALQGIASVFNPKASDFYRPASQGIMGFTPAELNRMNALGGYYSEPARAQRRAEKRLANLIKRRDEGKSYSQKNLDMLTAALEGAPSQAQFATKKVAAKSPKVGVKGFTARDEIRESRRGKYF
jgi:hypothetical protein